MNLHASLTSDYMLYLCGLMLRLTQNQYLLLLMKYKYKTNLHILTISTYFNLNFHLHYVGIRAFSYSLNKYIENCWWCCCVLVSYVYKYVGRHILTLNIFFVIEKKLALHLLSIRMHHSRLKHQHIHPLSRYQHKINYINALCLCSVKYMPFPTSADAEIQYEYEHNIVSLRDGKVATLAMNMYGYVADARNMSHLVWL